MRPFALYDKGADPQNRRCASSIGPAARACARHHAGTGGFVPAALEPAGARRIFAARGCRRCCAGTCLGNGADSAALGPSAVQQGSPMRGSWWLAGVLLRRTDACRFWLCSKGESGRKFDLCQLWNQLPCYRYGKSSRNAWSQILHIVSGRYLPYYILTQV